MKVLCQSCRRWYAVELGASIGAACAECLAEVAHNRERGVVVEKMARKNVVAKRKRRV